MFAGPIAVQLKSLKQPFRKALHTAAQIEAEGVQIDARSELRPTEISSTGQRQLRKTLDDLDLRVGSIAFPTRRGYADPEDLQRRVDGTLAAMRMASQLAARTLVFTMGRVPEPDEPDRDTLVDVLTTLSAQSEKLGVRLAAQSPAAEPEALAKLLEEFPESALGADLNPAELILHGQSSQEFVRVVGDRIIHVHAADAVRGLGGAGAAMVELGRGTADVPTLIGMLEEFNYRGWITVERRDSGQPIEDCANAIQFLRSL